MNLAWDPLHQAFFIGFFGCLMSAFPVAMLLLIPDNSFGRVSDIDVLNRKIQILQRDNEELRIDNILHRQVIDSLLQQKVDETIKGVS
jgi:hypothetical protein